MQSAVSGRYRLEVWRWKPSPVGAHRKRTKPESDQGGHRTERERSKQPDYIVLGSPGGSRSGHWKCSADVLLPVGSLTHCWGWDVVKRIALCSGGVRRTPRVM